MIPFHLHISTGISKLGPAIPSVNLPPVSTCRADAPCKRSCYARRGRFSYARCRAHLQNNLLLWQQVPAQYARDIHIAAHGHRYFRWHSSGDIPDADYLAMMVRGAEALPHTNFLAFTKQYELVNTHLRQGNVFPANLSIVLSAWGDWLPENPFGLPVAYIRFRQKPADIPTHAVPCRHFCGDCVRTGQSCWDLRPGQSVCFDEH